MEPTETKSMRNATAAETNRRRRYYYCYNIITMTLLCITVLEPNGRPNTTDGDEVRYYTHYTGSLQSEVV